MPTYEYSADDEQGRPCSGRIDSSTWTAAQDALRQRGWIVRTLQPVTEGARATVQEFLPAGGEPGTTPASALPTRRPNSVLLSLQALAEELPARRGRHGVQAVVRRLEAGEPLPEAFRAEQQQLPTELRGLVELGLPSGRIDILVNDYLEHCRRLSDLRRGVLMSLVYPLILLVILVAVIVFAFVLIVPMFSRIFEDFGTQLPALTMLFVTISRLVVNHGLWLLFGLLAIPAAIYVLARLIAGPGGPQSLFRMLPIVGQGFRWSSLSNLCHLLATLVELRVPLPQALRAAAGVCDDWTLAEDARRTATAIETGTTPRDAVKARGSWLSELAAAFHWSSRDGDFIESLRASAEVFGARSRVQTQLVFWVLQPVILFCVAVGTGLLVLALFMPLIKLLNDLS